MFMKTMELRTEQELAIRIVNLRVMKTLYEK